MSKLGTIVNKGKSGTSYTFDIYPFDTEFKAKPAVYYISKREKSNNGYLHTDIYIGETKDLSTRFDDHHKANCFTKKKANCKSILIESSEAKRLKIEKDILDGNTFPCND